MKRLRALPSWERVVGVVEGLKGEKWESFRDRYGDWGRDLVLYLGRKRCGLTLGRLGELAGRIDYGSVGNAVKRFEERAVRDGELKAWSAKAQRQLANGEM